MTTAEQSPELEPLPAWSLSDDRRAEVGISSHWPHPVTRDWAWGGSDGSGVRVCLLDSGIDAEHPLVGDVAAAYAIETQGDEAIVKRDQEGDISGHGTACASVIRRVAPGCELTSVRVLGKQTRGSGAHLIAGLTWAVQEEFDLINLSLSTTKRKFAAALHELADEAAFGRAKVVASAHNMPVESYPWRFAAVISVGSHEGDDPLEFFYNPTPPVEFFARGLDVEVAWSGGETIVATGNSFATPHMTGIGALVMAKHPDLTSFELKSVLRLTATNMDGADG